MATRLECLHFPSLHLLVDSREDTATHSINYPGHASATFSGIPF